MNPADHGPHRHQRHESGGCPITMREPAAEPVTPWRFDPHRRCRWTHKPTRGIRVKRTSR